MIRLLYNIYHPCATESLRLSLSSVKCYFPFCSGKGPSGELNGFFEVKDGVTETQVKALADELVEKSLKDEGNHGYDLFHSATRPDVYMFCETWESDDLLTKHSNAEHFTRLVPQIEALTKDGLHLERFEK